MCLFSCSAPPQVSKAPSDPQGLDTVIHHVTGGGFDFRCKIDERSQNRPVYEAYAAAMWFEFHGLESNGPTSTKVWITGFLPREHDKPDFGWHAQRPKELDDCYGAEQYEDTGSSRHQQRIRNLSRGIVEKLRSAFLGEWVTAPPLYSAPLENALAQYVARLTFTVTQKIWVRPWLNTPVLRATLNDIARASNLALNRETVVAVLADYSKEVTRLRTVPEITTDGLRLRKIDLNHDRILLRVMRAVSSRPNIAAEEIQSICEEAELNGFFHSRGRSSICKKSAKWSLDSNQIPQSEIAAAAHWYSRNPGGVTLWESAYDPWVKAVEVHAEEGFETGCLVHGPGARVTTEVTGWVIPIRFRTETTEHRARVFFCQLSANSDLLVGAALGHSKSSSLSIKGAATWASSRITDVATKWISHVVSSVPTTALEYGTFPEERKMVSELLNIADQVVNRSGPLTLHSRNLLLEKKLQEARWSTRVRSLLEAHARRCLFVATVAKYLELRSRPSSEPRSAHLMRSFLDSAVVLGRGLPEQFTYFQERFGGCTSMVAKLQNYVAFASQRGSEAGLDFKDILAARKEPIEGLVGNRSELKTVLSHLCRTRASNQEPFQALSEKLGVTLAPYEEQALSDPTAPLPSQGASIDQQVQDVLNRYSQYLVPLREYERHSLARQTAIGRETDPELQRCVPQFFRTYTKCMKQNSNQPLCGANAKEALVQCLRV